MSKHYKNETGTDLILDTGVELTGAVNSYIKYLKPDGITSGTFSASLYSSYSNILGSAAGTYLLKHTLVYADFDTAGIWKFQAYIGAANGTWFGETVDTTIYDVFQ